MNRQEIENDRRHYDNLANDFVKGKLSRRDFLKMVGMLGSGLALLGPATTLLASCTPATTALPTVIATAAGSANKTWPLTNATTSQLLDFYKSTLPAQGLPIQPGSLPLHPRSGLAGHLHRNFAC